MYGMAMRKEDGDGSDIGCDADPTGDFDERLLLKIETIAVSAGR
jgi:hypothetical protein